MSNQSSDPKTSGPELPEQITAIRTGGLDGYRIQTPLCTGTVYSQGAHVTEWTPAGQEPVLWMSKDTDFEADKPIRGGIPICWPWFGPGPEGNRTPAHGFARILPWSLVAAEVTEAGEARLAFELSGSQCPPDGGIPADAVARLTVGFGSTLTLNLTVTAGNQPVRYEEALHTYLNLGDISRVSVEGLSGARFLDKVHGGEAVQDGAIEFTTETDRIYFCAETLTLVDHSLGRRIQIQKADSANTVVWNPWIAKAGTMADFEDDGWRRMCCIEAVNCLANEISLEAGESHTMTTAILVP
ncbi:MULTISPECIES: D-hexose-6-phosphate mutarotase [unclassified Luteococcus]|uniref:D-hexose-6-phosphate mutarotase n=1 Tax=unclassified Luteococcus TaxID=2639923 RepID=UPI00313E9E9B